MYGKDAKARVRRYRIQETIKKNRDLGKFGELVETAGLYGLYINKGMSPLEVYNNIDSFNNENTQGTLVPDIYEYESDTTKFKLQFKTRLSIDEETKLITNLTNGTITLKEDTTTRLVFKSKTHKLVLKFTKADEELTDDKITLKDGSITKF